MNALDPLILEYAIKYGIPATLEIIKVFKKENPTIEDWEAAFKVAETPYGLTPKVIVTPPNP
jgi:hypothetical protein